MAVQHCNCKRQLAAWSETDTPVVTGWSCSHQVFIKCTFALLIFFPWNSEHSSFSTYNFHLNRFVNMSLCVGLPLWSWGGASEHAARPAEGRTHLAWAPLHGRGLVAAQHQQVAQVHWEGETVNAISYLCWDIERWRCSSFVRMKQFVQSKGEHILCMKWEHQCLCGVEDINVSYCILILITKCIFDVALDLVLFHVYETTILKSTHWKLICAILISGFSHFSSENSKHLSFIPTHHCFEGWPLVC